MPHTWNNILVVTREELVPTWWKRLGSLQKELKRYADKPYGIKRAQLGGNGRQLLVAFDSLPGEVQEGLGDPRKVKHPLEPFYTIDSAAVCYYSTEFVYPDGSYLTPEAQERYIISASVIRAILDLEHARKAIRLNQGGSLKGITATLCADAISFQEVLQVKHKIRHSLPTHPRHFKNTLTKFSKLGYISLVKDAKGKSKRNAQKTTPEIIKLLNDLFATQPHKPTATEVARQYEAFLGGYLEVWSNETGEVYNPKDMPKLSPSTVKAYLAGWENKIGTYSKRSGNRQRLMQQFKPYHSLEQPKFSGSLLSIDDRQPPFAYDKSKRLWFYNGIDLASGAFTCWVYGRSKAGLILEFYRQLVRNYAQWGLQLPDGLECESSLNSTFKDTLLREGVMFQHVRVEANNARGKRIEAYYRPLRYQYEKKREGWLARPFALSEANQAGSIPVPIVPYDKIIQGCLHDIEQWNNTEHSSVKGISRWEYFLQHQHPNLKPTNYKAILPHLGYKTETSCNAGIIRLHYREFLLGDHGKVALGANLIRLMKAVEGQELDVYWLDDNQGNVLKALVCLRGERRYICHAQPKPTYNRAVIERTKEDGEARKVMSSYVATIEGFRRKQARSLEPLTVLDNRPTTLNDKFQIDGPPSIPRPPLIPPKGEVGGRGLSRPPQKGGDTQEVEVLAEVQEDAYEAIPDQVSFKKDLKDRF